jgi:hypothetical protein
MLLGYTPAASDAEWQRMAKSGTDKKEKVGERIVGERKVGEIKG